MTLPFPNPFDECNCEGHGYYCEKCLPKLTANSPPKSVVVPLATVEAALSFLDRSKFQGDYEARQLVKLLKQVVAP